MADLVADARVIYVHWVFMHNCIPFLSCHVGKKCINKQCNGNAVKAEHSTGHIRCWLKQMWLSRQFNWKIQVKDASDGTDEWLPLIMILLLYLFVIAF